jgi:hypothetical protein
MTLRSPGIGIKGLSHDSVDMRGLVAAMFGAPMAAFTNAVLPTTAGGAHGVVGDGDCAVTQQGSPTMGVQVAAGRIVMRVGNASSLTAGVGTTYNDAAVNVAIAAADPTNPRIDLVCARWRFATEYAEAADGIDFFVVTGTPAASPAVPALTTAPNAVVLAQVAVAAAATQILNANITDKRPFVAAIGGVQRVLSTSQPSGVALYKGMPIWETDTFSAKKWTTATTGFVPDWNLPWGRMTNGSVVANGADQTGITVEADLTGLTVTMTAVASRRYRVSWVVTTIQVTSAGQQTLKVSADGTLTVVSQESVAAAGVHTHSGSFEVTGLAAGARIIKLRGLTSAGTLTIATTSQANARLIVEDMGPAANPA